ncbi:hypothetical protein [Lactobacillus crispatus]|uniref:Uncharacterized protein n=1 Tax=Lactobacillus crispatus TaxID=47770 RepID=A0A7H9E800_9LACO|nr:hypothetical protein [Lactobacillus crispatus]QLL73756.1 hypothetical protein GTO85_04905 [Lactobacillus crispatus]
MKSKEEKLREALNEYFGRDVGDVKGCFIDPASPTDYVPECPVDHTKQITILTKQHVPTFAEKRKELVDQLDNDLKEIDADLNAKALGENNIRIYDEGIGAVICDFHELTDACNFHLFDCYLSVTEMIKIMDAVSVFTQELERLKEQYEDETI